MYNVKMKTGGLTSTPQGVKLSNQPPAESSSDCKCWSVLINLSHLLYIMPYEFKI
jgi:hypothetical protein